MFRGSEGILIEKFGKENLISTFNSFRINLIPNAAITNDTAISTMAKSVALIGLNKTS